MVRARSRWEVWGSFTTKVSLRRFFDESISTGRATGRDGLSPAAFGGDVRHNIIRLNQRIRSNSHHFSAYKQVLKSKGAKSAPRVVSIPTVRDRILLRAMAKFLNEIEPTCSIELAQTKVARVIEQLQTGNFTHYIKLDVVNFYPSISHKWIREALNRSIRRVEVVDLFMRAIETPTLSHQEKHAGQSMSVGVPQGLAISNGLAELAIQHVDQTVRLRTDVAYFRFVDDVLVLTNGDQTTDIWSEIEHGLTLAGLKAHDPFSSSSKSETGLISGGFDFLGYNFLWPRVSVRKQSINRLEMSIARIFTRYKFALAGPPKRQKWKKVCKEKLLWHLNLAVSGCVFEGKRLGWLAYFSQIRHHQLLEHLDSIIEKQMKRFNLEGIDTKRFVESYRFAASKRVDLTGFVPNFDTMSVQEMRDILFKIFFLDERKLLKMPDEEIRERFLRKVRGVVVELERDISSY